MSGDMTCREAAELWGISERRIAVLCKEGRIPGVYRVGRSWMIPEGAEKPADKRLAERERRRPLPIGVSDFKEASAEYYYVDKTLLIRDFLDERPKVSLFTRPRRFGKTLNMDMLKVFFEKTDRDTSVYFKDKKIWKCGEYYRSFQGKYPVIFISFKDVKFREWNQTLEAVCAILRDEFARHRELEGSEKCNSYERGYYERVVNGTATEVELSMALAMLSQMLDHHHGIAPLLMIDEYDTPIQQGYVYGYYEDVILFMRNLFSGGFKDNPHLSFGVLTGILRVAKESIFSGMNNLKVNSIMDDRYSSYFGFTKEEVRGMAEYYQVSDHYEEIGRWYDGYRFGNTDIFNPWSVIGYFNNDCRPQAFWVSTGSNEIIGDILLDADRETVEQLYSLMNGERVFAHIDTSVIYPQIRQNPGSIYSFLLVTGYLKAEKIKQQFSGDYICEVSLPNQEIFFVYSREILRKIEKVISPSSALAIQEALYSRDGEQIQKALQAFLVQTISYNDASSESFYHGLVLGLCAVMDNRYCVTSNRESGDGRFDIQLMPKENDLPGILMELKAGKGMDEKQLSKLSREALRQIGDRGYDAEMKSRGVKMVLRMGVAFCGKRVQVAGDHWDRDR